MGLAGVRVKRRKRFGPPPALAPTTGGAMTGAGSVVERNGTAVVTPN